MPDFLLNSMVRRASSGESTAKAIKFGMAIRPLTVSETIQMIGEDLSVCSRCHTVPPADGKGVEIITHGTGLPADTVAVPSFGFVVRRAGGTDIGIKTALVALEVEDLKNRDRPRSIFGDIEHHIKVKMSAVVVTVDAVLPAQSDTFESLFVFCEKFQFYFFGSRRDRPVKCS